MRRLLVLGLLAAALALGACSAPAGPLQSGNTQAAQGDSDLAGTISVAGSTTVQPLAEKLAEGFSTRYPQVRIDVQGGGSSVGVRSVGGGAVQVGMASREITAEEKAQYPDLQVVQIALDGIAIVANPSVTVSNLTREQARDIFSGRITNWNQVGGADKPIVVVAREEGSGTRGAFEELVMGEDVGIVADAILQNSNGAVRTTVGSTPDSVGFLSFGYLDQSVKALTIEGVEATEANAAAGTYPIVRPLNLLTKGRATGVVKAWLDYILSAAGQQIVAEESYIAVRE